MDEDKESRMRLQQITACALEQFTLLQNSSQSVRSRSNREAHPKAVLSTKQKLEEPSSSDSAAAAGASPRLSSQVVSSPRCIVSRQHSTPVDLPSPTRTESMATAAADETSSTSNRPATLQLYNREMSNFSRSSSSNSQATPCPPPLSSSPNDGRQLVSSYPPGPEQCRQLSWEEERCRVCSQPKGRCLCCPAQGDPNKVLARRIAERLIKIGDNVNYETESFHLTDVIDTWLCTLSTQHASHNLSWRNLAHLYSYLSRLLTETLSSNGQELEGSESWQRFEKLWRMVLHTGVSWIADNGGWSAFIRETDYTAHAHYASSTPDCRRRSFTSTHPPPPPPTHYSTPQVSRRGGFNQFQSSPTLRSARGSERGSRVLSLTQEGVFALEGVCGEEPSSVPADERENDREELKINDEGIQFAATPSSSQSSFASDGYSSPVMQSNGHCMATPIQPRPQSSTVLGEGPLGTEGTMYDRNRSLSYPTRRRPSSASRAAAAGRQAHSAVLEDREIMTESLDSGLDASSQTSLASTDSSLQYSTLGVSAFCVYEAVKSMLDHQ